MYTPDQQINPDNSFFDEDEAINKIECTICNTSERATDEMLENKDSHICYDCLRKKIVKTNN